MTIEISPEVEQYVQEQVATGRFASATAVFEASIRQMMSDVELDDEDLAAIEASERDIAAGRVHSIADIRREFLGE